MRPDRLRDVLDAVARQTHPEVELVLVTHGFEVPAPELAALSAERGLEHVRAVPADSALTLGACMNLGVDAADGTYVAKMDDDNFYGRHYLADLVAAFGGTSAQVVGKWAHLTYLESTGTVLLRFPAVEQRYSRLVQGGTILVEREVARDLRFEDLPRRVDTTFLDKVRAHGGRVYATDRFGFVSVRSARTAGHTWRVSDAELLAKPSRVLFYGEPWEYADV
ncbi:glycosyltransferase family 2 protein [Cellulomonas sp. DKR-3]|uniref:Glycosyltransferase family 2 protein n=2 Tax=Cellulomonas fulva TaxID=2835530 RepID=A0ABS5TZX7_9CELL|nr:glycosyltransferase family 2 protein [Cellulomonas fulva]